MFYGGIINFPVVTHQMDEEVGREKRPQHDQSRMVLFNLFDLNLTCIQIVEKAKYERHGQNSNTHLERIHEGNEAKDSQGRDGIIGLVVYKVAHNTILKLLHILVFWHLKPKISEKYKVFSQLLQQTKK